MNGYFGTDIDFFYVAMDALLWGIVALMTLVPVVVLVVLYG